MDSCGYGRRTVRALLLVAIAAASLAATWRLRPLAPSASAAADVDVVRGCEWLGWVLVGYLATAVACAALAQLAGSSARVGLALHHLAPGRIRDLVDFAMTVGVAASIGASAAAVPAVAVTPTSSSSTQAVTGATSGLDWPGLVGGTRGRDLGTVIRPGDTLWTIAARHLPADASAAEISAAWHAWYAANRDLIGPDPALIHPGQHLTPPASIRRTR